jgi:hypothetical protein
MLETLLYRSCLHRDDVKNVPIPHFLLPFPTSCDNDDEVFTAHPILHLVLSYFFPPSLSDRLEATANALLYMVDIKLQAIIIQVLQ